MNFDFSCTSTPGNIDGAAINFRDYISGSLLKFIKQYSHYFEDGLSSTKSSFVADPAQNFVKLVGDVNLQLERIQEADNAAGNRSNPLSNVQGVCSFPLFPIITSPLLKSKDISAGRRV